jgi:acyl carrier protein
MDSKQLLELVKEVMESDDITLDTEFDEESWDSLAVVTFIALVSEKYDIVYNSEKAIMAKRVSELLD